MKALGNPKNLELNLARIAMLGESREDENIDFRMFLKGQDPDNVDRIVHKINKEVIAQIDCQQCGNCCKNLKPCVSESEIKRLAQIKNMAAGELSACDSNRTLSDFHRNHQNIIVFHGLYLFFNYLYVIKFHKTRH